MKSIIGLEVHVELKAKSKMFCGCSTNYFGQKPNTHTCPVCLGLPGALPVPNRTAIEWCVMLGMALNCNIPLFSKFDRKNYFYPDLPKGYQISQYDKPFCLTGKMTLDSGKIIRITRIHMEEDTGKLIHDSINGEEVTLIDFNRSGVPLVEIVTEPDFDNVKDVKDYLQKLQQIVRYLGISNADMEKGNMRLEPNISVSNDGKLPNYKVEVKNINSFKFVEKAIDYEFKRHTKILKEGKMPVQETRGWNEAKQKTISQRIKEEASDYRYFPEPDIPPIKWTNKKLEKIKKAIPELPQNMKIRFVNKYHITEYNAKILIKEKGLASYFEETIRVGSKHNINPKAVANYIINRKVNFKNLNPDNLIKSIVSSTSYVKLDKDKIKNTVSIVLKENSRAAKDYKEGKSQVLQFLIGETIKKIKERIEPKIIIEEINTQIR